MQKALYKKLADVDKEMAESGLDAYAGRLIEVDGVEECTDLE